MGKKQTGFVIDDGMFDRTKKPIYPTSVVGKSSDGRVLTEDGACWGVFRIPTAPIVDAKSDEAKLESSLPFMHALSVLGEDSASSMSFGGRRMNKSSYREVHVLYTSLDVPFVAPRNIGERMSDLLTRSYEGVNIIQRTPLLLVRLVPNKLKASSIRESIESVIEVFRSGYTTLFSDFDDDFSHVKNMLSKCGVQVASRVDIAIAMNWWGLGSDQSVYRVATDSNLVLCDTFDAARIVQEKVESGEPIGEWVDEIDGRTYTVAGITDFAYDWTSALDLSAMWVTHLVNAGAVCISLHMLLEPSKITAKEIDKNRKAYQGDRDQLYKYRGESTVEVDEKIESLEEIRRLYKSGNAPVTATGLSAVVVFAGTGATLSRQTFPGVSVAVLKERQAGGLGETFMGSTVRANPVVHDVPITTIAFGGFAELSRCGDAPSIVIRFEDQEVTLPSGLLGFTELDRQPVWINPGEASTNVDRPPLILVVGQSGSGKTMLLLWLLWQWQCLQYKTVFIDLKEGSDFSDLFLQSGGTVISLDDIASVDGALDPLRYMSNVEEAVKEAAKNLIYVNPWGSKGQDYETAVNIALAAGAKAGARSTLGALIKARELGNRYATNELVDKAVDFGVGAENPYFRALFGREDTGPRLAFDSVFTLIKSGQSAIRLPSNPDKANITERINVALVRSLLEATARAVRPMSVWERQGVVAVDEAWTVLKSSPDEVDRLGRLLRSMRVTALFATQKASDSFNGGLDQFFASGFVLPMDQRDEAVAACGLAHVAATEERVQRLCEPGEVDDGTGRLVPNWTSMRALVERDEAGIKRVVRGTCAIVSDMHNRTVVTEIRLPSWFLDMVSTNAEDRMRQERRRQQQANM